MTDRKNAAALRIAQSSFLSSGCFFDYFVSGQLTPMITTSSLYPVHEATEPTVALRCAAALRLFVALDYDGTLVSIASRPEEARPTATVLDLLSRLAQTPDITVVIVSGRPLADLRTLLPIPGVAYIGTHGLEICTAEGAVSSLLPPGAFSTILSCLRRDAERLIAGVPGVFLEDKGQALALHYRLAPQETAARLVPQFLANIRGYQTRGVALEVLHGKKTLEVCPVGVNKGKALQFFLRSRDPATLPLYIGDDATDEAAFRALHRHGITILVADPPRHTFAQYYVRNPDEVSQLITRMLDMRDTA